MTDPSVLGRIALDMRTLVLLTLASLTLPASVLACSVSVDGMGVVPKSDAGAPEEAPGGPSATPAPEAGAPTSGCSADLSTDPKNCGACGHDCLGGACAGGACQPVRLAPIDAPIVADANHVYAANGDAILELAKTADAKPVTLASGVPFAFSLAVDFANVYAAPESSPARLYRVAKSGGSPAQLLSSTTPQGGGVAVNDFSVFFVTFQGAILYVPKGLTNVQPIELVPAPQGGRPFVVDATTVAWVKNGAVQSTSAHGIDGTIHTLGTGTNLSAVALDASFVYFVDRGVAIRRAPRAGGPSSVVVAALDPKDLDAFDLLIDDANVYWLSRESARLFRAPKTGGAYVSMSPIQPGWLTSMTSDAVSVMWSDGAGIFRIAK